MAPESISNSSNQQAIKVPAPLTGESLDVASVAGGILELGFDPGAATASRSGNDLVFDVDGGGTVTLTDFFVVGDEALPSLVLPSGDEVASADYLASFDIDISTAAGPAAGPAGNPSSGSGEYGDESGSLINGVARIGSLGTNQWGRATDPSVEYTGLNAGPDPAISITPIIPGPGGNPGDPSTPDNPVYYMAADGYNLKVDESYMEGGTNYDPEKSDPVYQMDFLITTNDGLASVLIDGVSYAVAGGTLTGFPAGGISGDSGMLYNPVVVDNGDGTYNLSFTYQQGDAVQHADGEGKNVEDNADSWTIGVTSVNGATDSVVANVDIVDDIPVISVTDGSGNLVGIESAIVGTWDPETVSFGYDGAGENGGVFIGGEKATPTPDGGWTATLDDGSVVTLDGRGNVWYKPPAPVEKATHIVVPIKIVDGDGDEVNGAASGKPDVNFWLVNSPKDVTSLTDDSALSDGAGVKSYGNECIINASELGDGWTFVPGQTGNHVVDGTVIGKYEVSADGSSLKYTQTAPYDHQPNTNEKSYDEQLSAGKLPVNVEHKASGETDSISLDVKINDDGPVLGTVVDEEIQLGWSKGEDGKWHILPEEGSVEFKMGADGLAEKDGLTIVDGDNTTITFNAEGVASHTYADGSVFTAEYTYNEDGNVVSIEYSYTPGLNSPAEREFTFTGKDGDGDTISQKIEVEYDRASVVGPSVDKDTTYVSETDIKGNQNVHAGTDAASLDPNNLDDAKENDNANESVNFGSIPVDFGPSGMADEPFAWAPEGPALEAMVKVDGEWGWHEVEWSYGADKTTLIGSVNGQPVLTVKGEVVTVTAEDGKTSQQIDYTVELDAAVRHEAPESGADYNRNIDGSGDPQNGETDLSFNFTATSGNGQSSDSSLTVVVQDDVLDFGDNGVSGVSVEPGDIADMFYSHTDPINFNGYKDADYMAENGLTFSAKKAILNPDGTVKELVDLPGGKVVHSTKDTTGSRGHTPYENGDGTQTIGNGLGITSTNNGGRGSDQEIEFIKDGADGAHASEALVISLPEGQISFGVTIDLNLLFTAGSAGDASAEYAMITLMRDGKVVGSYPVTADSNLGNYKSQFSVEGGFDEIVITAYDKEGKVANTSDFTVGGLQFTEPNIVEYITANITGSVAGGGADGIDMSTFTFLNDANSPYTLEDGSTLRVTVVDGKVVGTIVGPGGVETPAFDVFMNEQGTWDYLQYKHFTLVDKVTGEPLDDQNLHFGFGVKDNDGDYTSSYINVPIPEAPIPGEAQPDADVFNEDASVLVGAESVLDNDQDYVKDEDGNAISKVSNEDGTAVTELNEDGLLEITGQYGTLFLDPKTGDYSYELARGEDGKALDSGLQNYFDGKDTNLFGDTDQFTYTVTGPDGEPVTSTLDIKFQNNVFDHGDNGSNTITGGGGNDVLVGDPGGAGEGVYAAYNVALVVDTSGSMTNMSYVQTALTELVTQLKNVGASDNTMVNISLVGFESRSSLKLQISDFDSDKELADLVKAIKALSANGGTNYESAFLQAANWFHDQPDTYSFANGPTVDYKDVVYFVTDGKPTYHVPDSYSYSGYYPNALDLSSWKPGMVIETPATNGGYKMMIDGDGVIWRWKGNNAREWTETSSIFKLNDGYQGSTTNTKDSGDALAVWQDLLNSKGVEVNAIGLGSNIKVSDLAGYDNTKGAIVISSTGNQLKDDLAKELIEGGSIDWNSIAGADNISGGEGNDLIFGDAMTADWILGLDGWDSGDLVPGQSLDIVMEYVRQTGGFEDYEAPGFNDAMREFIGDNAIMLGQSEDDRGAADVIFGEAGDDTIFGQGGNDTINGGDGNDDIYGGLGSDVMFGGAGSDTFVWNVADLDNGTDKIMDFNLNEGDKISLGDLLPENDSLDVLLGKGDISGKVTDDGIELTVKHGDTTQTIEVHFEGDRGASFIDSYNDAAGNDAAQQALLNEMIKSMFN
ncbi:VWA domain-containing protein [Desulfovibrio sp. OttesenSCG-928-I05]|nr:VWA domain-containing protein [Desulfovibrio sp. OttesenSCG-928-I05]